MSSNGTPKPRQWHRALENIRGSIIDGQLQAGEKLTETRLATELGISRTPLREALLQLESEGLLVRQRGGYSVASFSLADVIDAIELRGFIEGAAVRCAVERGVSSEKTDAIADILEKLDTAVAESDHTEYGTLNTSFHEALAGLSSSEMFKAEVLRAYRLPFAHPSGFPTNSAGTQHLKLTIADGQKQHREIFELIISGDGVAAAELLLTHARHAIANVEAAYLEKIKTNNGLPSLALVV